MFTANYTASDFRFTWDLYRGRALGVGRVKKISSRFWVTRIHFSFFFLSENEVFFDRSAKRRVLGDD